MKAKKLLKRVMESRSDKKTSKKVRKRNNKFLAGLYYANAPAEKCPCHGLDKYAPTKDEWVAWLKSRIEDSQAAIAETDVSDPVESIMLLAVEFEFWDPQKDPVKVLVSDGVDVSKLLRKVRIVDTDIIENVDPNPEQTED